VGREQPELQHEADQNGGGRGDAELKLHPAQVFRTPRGWPSRAT
jgi:hypothetical protein